jgi:hypothetical protein
VVPAALGTDLDLPGLVAARTGGEGGQLPR